MIPKIVHQIYWNFKVKNGEMPDEWKKLSIKCQNLYKKNNWEYFLWDKKQGYELVRKNFPELRKLWLFATNIEKVDILRYVIMYIYGGMYLDLDTDCIKIYKPLENYNIILGSTACSENFFLKHIYSINNNILLSTPNNLFWKHILDRIKNYHISDIFPKFIRISMYTGPYCLQTVYNNYPDKKSIFLHKELSIAEKNVDSETFFVHISSKSWINILDSIHLCIFLFIIPILILIVFLPKYTHLILCTFLFLCISITFLLCRKNS